jgi:hypothetical protein
VDVRLPEGAHDEIGWAYGVICDDVGDCGCGYTEGRLEVLRQVLRDCPLYEDERWRKYDSPLAEWLLCVMTNADLLEHGGSVGGSWITDKGKRLLAVLDSEDGWKSLTEDEGPSYGYCEHCLKGRTDE